MVHTNTNDSFIQKDTKTFSGGSKQINCVFRALIQKASNKIEVEKFQATQITDKDQMKKLISIWSTCVNG